MKVCLFSESIVQDLVNMNDYEYSGNEFNIKNLHKSS